MNQPEQWIVVRNWDGPTGFQHYKHRRPAWVKNYTELLADHNYLSLTLRERAILHGIWLAYAASRRELGASPAELGRILGDNSVRTRDLERLNHAGFIELSASKPLDIRVRSREVEEEKDKSTYVRTSKEESYPQATDEELFDYEKINTLLREMP